MKITRLECWHREFILKEPYTIAYETIDRCDNVFIKARTNEGISGWGCAAPDKTITNETGETVLSAFKNSIEPFLKGENPFRYAALMEELKKQLKHQPSALAMADMLLYDLMSKKARVPLYQFLGGFRDHIPTSMTIGILPAAETVKKARRFARQGFTILKIKGGKNVAEDIERVLKVHEAVGSSIAIRFDANQGYSVKDAVKFIKKTVKAGIELLEQPTSQENEELLGKVSRRVPVPVMADECLMSLKDVFRLTKKDLTDMINIKLMKVGGITEALHINSVARAAGVEVMVGCMDESALAISAGLHFALSRPNIIYADLDSFLDISDDPFAGIITLKDGILYPGKKWGLGKK